MSTDDESATTAQVQGLDAPAVSDTSLLTTAITFLVTILTLGIPAFYASATTRFTSSTFGKYCTYEVYIVLMYDDC